MDDEVTRLDHMQWNIYSVEIDNDEEKFFTI